MTDFEHRQARYWHDNACRKAELIGAITSYVDAVQDATARLPITAEQAIDRIAKLLAEYAERTGRPQGTVR